MSDPILNSCRIDHLSSYCDFHATVDVLRLDLVHPVVSGNKWFKLKEYLADAKQQQKVLLTFGGAFSNHIVATAAAARQHSLKCIGVIRGEDPFELSHTLQQARTFGMDLYFSRREAYKSRQVPESVLQTYAADDLYIIPEGGYGLKGAAGAREILQTNETGTYTHIISAVGTGTTLAGLTAAARSGQKVIGISVLKNVLSLQEEISLLLPQEKQDQFQLLHDYHFGGYAKRTPELLKFMNEFYEKTGVPTDFVYTAKAFFAAFDLVRKDFFSPADRILLVHTGGLQGNFSLPKGTLIYG
jgi:1-aminocyclopropane-1-carboxylate deaminase